MSVRRIEALAEPPASLVSHGTYDRAYALSYLVNWLITALHGYGRAEREVLIREYAEGARRPAGPPEVTAALDRHAPLAAVVTEFIGRLEQDSRETAYPLAAIHQILESRYGGV